MLPMTVAEASAIAPRRACYAPDDSSVSSMSSTIRLGTSVKLSQNSSTIAAIMRMSAVAPGRFSSPHMVGWETGPARSRARDREPS